MAVAALFSLLAAGGSIVTISAMPYCDATPILDESIAVASGVPPAAKNCARAAAISVSGVMAAQMVPTGSATLNLSVAASATVALVASST